MNRILLFLFLGFSFTVHSQYTLTPDPEFERFLVMQGYDTTVDGKVLTSSINTVTELDIFPGSGYVDIKELTGIEDFTSLKKLNCSNCQLNTLDLSKNIALTELICEKSKLTELNLSNCVNLEKLMCSGNLLTSIDLSTNINLKSLTCQYGILTNLNIEKCTLLEILSLGGNNLNTIDLSPFDKLLEFGCSDNQLTSLDITKNPLLTALVCDNNHLTNLNTSANSNLTNLICRNNNIQGLDFTYNTKLTDLLCEKNQITKLDFTNNPEILTISCSNNKISEIDISKNTELYSLICDYNELKSLDVFNNKKLNVLTCGFNEIEKLDVSKNIALGLLRCNNNKLTLLDLRSPVSWTWWNDYNGWFNNPDLRCIYVPDASFFGHYWNSRKDDTATYFDGTSPKFESSTQTICSKQNPTINDIIVDGLNIKWFDSETSTTQLPLNTTLMEGKTYYAMNTAGICEGSRSSVKVTMKQINAPAGTSPQNFCNIENPTLANLNVSGTNIKWYSSLNDLDLIANTTPLVTGSTYYATQSNNGCESAKIPILVNVVNTSKPTISSPQTFCIQENATLATINSTNVENPKWYDALTAGALLPNTSILLNDKTYYASQTINGCESERVAIVIKIQDTPTPIGDNNQPFCTGQNPTLANIIVTGENIKWYDASINGNVLANTANLQNGITYYASQTINSCKGQRLAVTVSIQNTPLTPTGDLNPKFCKSENATLASINFNGQNLKWYDSNISAAILPNTTLLQNNTTYYVSQTVGCESERQAVLVNVYDTALPTATAQQTFCKYENAIIDNISITGNNLKWYDASTAGNILANTTLLENKIYYASQTNNNCESLRIAVNVKIQDTEAPIADANQSFCVQQNTTIKNIKISGQNVKWYNSETAGTNLSEATPLENGIIYYASQTFNNCESERTPIRIQILEATTTDCINFEEELPFPKFFTPNNDGYNDTWTIDFAYLAPNIGIRIFDRYGKFIQEINKNNPWNGTYLGGDVPTSDYWFIVKRINGAEFRGHFSLKR